MYLLFYKNIYSCRSVDMYLLCTKEPTGSKNKNISFTYNQPYFLSSLNSGLSISGRYVLGREVGYQTSYDNKTLNFDKNYYTSKIIGGSIAYTYRRAIKVKHVFSVSFSNIAVDDSVITKQYNPNYFNSASPTQNIIDFTYSYQFTDLDNVVYPLKGTNYRIGILKRGLGISNGLDMLSIDGNYKKFWELRKNLFADISTYGNVRLPFYQAYINQGSLGYGDNYLRGLQYYVIDGVVTGYVKSTLRKKIFGYTSHLHPRSIFYRYFPHIPFNFYAKALTDIGGVYNKPEFNTFLSNKFLYTTGVGIDFVTVYDFSLSAEFCFNQLNQKGVFLQIRSAF